MQFPLVPYFQKAAFHIDTSQTATLPVEVTNFPEQTFDWTGLFSLIISLIALILAAWTFLWTKKSWEREGAVLETGAMFGLRSNSAIGLGNGNHCSLGVTVANTGRTPTQCTVSAIEFYGKSAPSEIIQIFFIAETITLESGSFWRKDYDFSQSLAQLRQRGEQISHATILLLTARALERHEIDGHYVDYLNKQIRAG